METFQNIFTAHVYIYDQLNWHLKDEDRWPQLEINRENDTDSSGIFRFALDGFIEVSCKMKIDRFPFDIHKCRFMGSSNIYTTEVHT